MAWRFIHEIGRKIIHFTILIVLAVYFAIKQQSGQQIALLFLVIILMIFLVLEFFRLEMGFKLPFFHQFVRPKEQHRLYGVIFFLASTIIALAVFDVGIALAALLMTTFGDTAAAIVGKKYGTTLLFRNKTAAGFVAELITNLIVAVGVSVFFTLNIYILIVMAFVATVVETMVDDLDDNLVVPIAAGIVGQLLFFLIVA